MESLLRKDLKLLPNRTACSQHLTTPFPRKARLLSSGYLPQTPKAGCRWACEVELLKKKKRRGTTKNCMQCNLPFKSILPLYPLQ